MTTFHSYISRNELTRYKSKFTPEINPLNTQPNLVDHVMNTYGDNQRRRWKVTLL